MTSVHLPKLLSIEDWDALPEDNSAHIELQDGVLIATPRPVATACAGRVPHCEATR